MDAASRIQNLGTILGVWAHPDDEVFTCGGILSIAAHNHQDVLCMTATRGEAGVQDESRWPAAKLGEIRTQELKASYEILGRIEHCWCDMPDGRLASIDYSLGLQNVYDCIDRCKPDTILTFGPDGMTGHDDHKMVSRWAYEAGRSLQIPVYYAVQTPASYQAAKEADEKFNMFFNIEKPPIINEDDCALLIDLPDEVLAKKCEALAAMPSQTERLFKELGQDKMLDMMRTEAFVLAK